MESNKSLGQGISQALLFPFHLGTLVYNIAFLVLMLMLSAAISSSMTSNFQYLAQSSENKEFSQAMEKWGEMDFDKEIDNNPMLSEEQKEQFKKLVNAQKQLTEGLNEGFGGANESAIAPSEFKNPLPLLLLGALLGLIILTRNMDIAAQTMIGDFGKPSLNPVRYVSPFIALKYVAAMILLMIGFFILALIPIINILALVAMLAFYFFYFAFVYTLIRSNSIMESINPKNWITNISNHLSWFNYCMLILFIFFTFLFSAYLGNVIMVMTLENIIVMLIALAVIQYFSFHILTSCFYLLGYISQMNDAEGFEGLGSEAIKNIERVDIVSQQRNVALDEVKSVYQNGYIDDAIELAKRNLKNQQNPTYQIELKQFLAKLYQEKGNTTAATEIEDEITDDILTKHPEKIVQIFPSLAKKIKAKELDVTSEFYPKLAEIAYHQSDIDLVKLLTKKFAAKHPNDKQLANLYFFIAKGTLEKENNAEQAYKILFSLVKKYPDHPQVLDFKSMLALTKKRVIRERQQQANPE